jgi:glycosyltransferase involved in cell wall biosynthesis
MQTHLPGANFWGLLLQLNGQATCIPTIHNNREFDYGNADHTLRAWFRRSAYRLMMKRCPAVVAVSKLVMESMAEQLDLKPDEADTMVVVPNGVPLPDPIDDATRCDIRTRFDCPDNVPLLVAAGRHTEQKNFRVLIEAAALLKDRGTDFRLVLAGEGELWADHKDLIDRLNLVDLVLMPGNIADLGQIMQEADLFILPSLWEGLPLVLLEAMAAECAVVGTRIAGIDEVLHDDSTGRIVEPDNAMELAGAIGELMASPDDRQRLAANARALVESDYSFDRVGRDLGELYRRITDPD